MYPSVDLVNFLCDKFFLYQNIGQLFADRATSDNILILPHIEALSTTEALRYLMETKKVNIKPSFIRELLYCTKFNGNKDLVELVSDILKQAENSSEL